MEGRLYVLTRGDLEKSYQAVQAGHAVAQFLLENPESNWKNNYLIYLNVKDEEELKYWMWKLNKKGIKYSEFKEPDINNETTAVAVANDNNIFKKLKLL